MLSISRRGRGSNGYREREKEREREREVDKFVLTFLKSNKDKR